MITKMRSKFLYQKTDYDVPMIIGFLVALLSITTEILTKNYFRDNFMTLIFLIILCIGIITYLIYTIKLANNRQKELELKITQLQNAIEDSVRTIAQCKYIFELIKKKYPQDKELNIYFELDSFKKEE